MKRPGTRADVRHAARPHPRRACRASPSARPSSSASPARPRPTSTSCAASSPTIGFDHVGVFTYSHEEGTSAVRAGRRRAGAVEAARRERRDGACRSGSWPGASRRGSASASGSWWTARRRPRAGPAGRGWRPRRPTSTPWSTSPNATRRPIAPGDFVEVEDRRRAGATTCWCGRAWSPCYNFVIREPGCRTEWACAHFFCLRASTPSAWTSPIASQMRRDRPTRVRRARYGLEIFDVQFRARGGRHGAAGARSIGPARRRPPKRASASRTARASAAI